MKPTKIALVTGGVRGIGKAIIEELLSNNYFVYTTYLSDEISAKEIDEKYENLKIFQSNVSDFESAKKLVTKIIEEKGQIDVLVNNAGITIDKTLPFMTEKAWKEVIDTNLNGTFYFTRLVGKEMVKSRKGNIINISSIASKLSIKGQSNYSASKAGIEALTRIAAKEYAIDGVRVNSVSPGFIETSMTTKLNIDVKKEIPLNRLGNPSEVAKAVVFLINEDSSYITGQNLIIDGGLSL